MSHTQGAFLVSIYFQHILRLVIFCHLKFKKYLVENGHNVIPLYHSTPGKLSKIFCIQNEKLGIIGDVCRQLHILILISPLSYHLHMFYSPGSLLRFTIVTTLVGQFQQSQWWNGN